MDKGTLGKVLLCGDCSDLIKAIDVYLSKANKRQLEEWKQEGYVNPEGLQQAAEQLEKNLLRELECERELAQAAVQSRYELDGPEGVMEELEERDCFAEKAAAIFLGAFSALIPSLANQDLQRSDPALSIDQLSKQTTDTMTSYSETLGEQMQSTAHTAVEKLLEKAEEVVYSKLEHISPEQARPEWESPKAKKQKQANPKQADLMEPTPKQISPKRPSPKRQQRRDDKKAMTALEAHRKAEVERIVEELEGQKSHGVFARERAYKIAHNEVLTAHNTAKFESVLQNPSAVSKRWRHSGAHKNTPRGWHVTMNGTVVKKRRRFIITGGPAGTVSAMYPRDPNLPPSERINCHCILQEVIDENILGLPLEERQRLQRQALEEADREWEKERAKLSTKTRVDKKAIHSAAYRRKFDKLTDDKKLNRMLYQDAKAMLAHRDGGVGEDISLIHSVSGIKRSSTVGTVGGRTKYTKAMERLINKAEPHTLISIHNHPQSMPPSIDDILSATEKKYKMGIVVCHDGKVFQYQAFQRELELEEYFSIWSQYDSRVAKHMSTGYNEYESQLKALADVGVDFEEITL